MLKNFSIYFIILIYTFFLFNPVYCNLNLKSQTSAIQISSGSTFYVENEITNYNGKLIREDNSTLEGQNIIFNNGILEDDGNKINISGTLTPDATNKIYLNGNTNLRMETGDILQTIEISNFNNYINGTILCLNDITLQDINTSVTSLILNELPVNIQLNDGMLFLNNNLSFKDDKKIIGPGKIFLNNWTLSFGFKDLTFEEPLIFDNSSNLKFHSNINLNETWTFSGNNNVITTENNTITLNNSGQITIDAGSSLMIKNTTLNCINSNNLCCLDNAGKITFQNVNILLSNDYTFSSGCFDVINDLKISGSFKFIYQSPIASTIKSNGTISLSNNLTFSYNPNIANHNLITFENETSSLILNNATLHTTTTHLQLTKGNVVINENAYLSSDETGQIMIGNNNSDDDFYCEFLNDARLNLTAGKLVYQNINSDAWKMNAINTVLNLYSYTTLNLQQNLNLQEGYANFYLNSSLETQTDKYLLGAVSNINEYQ